MKRRFLAGMLAFVLLFSNMSLGAYATPLEKEVSVSENTTGVLENVIDKEDTVSENAVEEEIVSEDNSGEETTVSGNDATEETTDEDKEEPLTEEIVIEASASGYSMTESFLVDTTAPYDGNYLLVANTNTNANGALEFTGLLPNVAPSASMYGNDGGSEDGVAIAGYDNWGRGLIDPGSYLDELQYDEDNSAGGTGLTRAVTNTGASYQVGDTRYFYLENGAEGYYNKTQCVCAAVGTHSTVWVPVDDPIYVENPTLMRTYMSTLATEFDSQHQKMITMFGSDETADYYGDRDGKTALVCYDIWGDGSDMYGSYVGGYFFGADLDFGFTNATGSDCDMLHIDSWQGMYRDATNNVLREVLGSKSTIVHEFQHMINFAVARDNDPYRYSFETPVYLNEAFSMAAEHLCYGPSVCNNRVQYYNAYSGIATGSVSLMRWGAYDTLSNYALSYLFGQYIRTQYKNGDTIYRDAMNLYDGSKDFLGIIADLLDVKKDELLLNFRIALFQKNAEGKYGFDGEEWAENINQQPVSGSSAYFYPGAAAVVQMKDSYTPSGAGSNIDFVGMYLELTDDDVEVSISGDNAITEIDGQIQLSASVSPKGVSQDVIFSIPYDSDKAYAMVTTDGLVTAKANGTVRVRATSVYNPAKFAEMSITITGQQRVSFTKTSDVIEEGGYRVGFAVTEPANAQLYYTYMYVKPYANGNLQKVNPDDLANPTAQSDLVPGTAFEFTDPGTHILKVVGIAEGCVDNLVTSVYEVKETPVPFVTETQNPDGTYTITIQAEEGTTICYTTDGTDPTRNPEMPGGNGTIYTGPFVLNNPGWFRVSAIAYKWGEVTSGIRDKVIEVPVPTPQIKVENVPGGKRVTIETAGNVASTYYTLDGSEPEACAEDMYWGTFMLDEEAVTVVKAVAVTSKEHINGFEEGDDFELQSPVNTKTVVVGKTKDVVASRLDSVAEEGEKIFLYSATGETNIYYTTNGATPSEHSTLYSENSPIIMTDDRLQIRAFARSLGNIDSNITEFVYVPYREITSLALEQETAELYTNVEGRNTLQLTATIMPDTVYAEQLKWKTSDASVVSVDKNGRLTAHKSGTAVITVSSGAYSDTCSVVVRSAVDSIEVLNESLKINKNNGTLQLQTAVYPQDATNKNLLYRAEMSDRTDDKGIAFIDENGKLSAVKDGEVKVIITPEDNAAGMEPVVVYVTISNQRNYNNIYKPKLSANSFTVNKKALQGYALNVYSIGVGTEVQDVAISEGFEYADYFAITKDDVTGKWLVSLTESRGDLRNTVYKVPLTITTEVSLAGCEYEDVFTTSVRIKVIDREPNVRVDNITINRYSSQTEYPLALKNADESVSVLGLLDNEGSTVLADNFRIDTSTGVSLVLINSINSIEALNGKKNIKGYLRIQVDGYAEQKVPITITLLEASPKFVVDSEKQMLNYSRLISEPTVNFTLAEKIGIGKYADLEDIQNASVDYGVVTEETAQIISGISVLDGRNIRVTLNTTGINAGKYKIPVLVSTSGYRDVPVTFEMTVQRENAMPKVTLESTSLKLNKNYPGETDSVKVKSISQTNVELTGFVIEPEGGSQVMQEVLLAYDADSGCLNASIAGTTKSNTYRFYCTPEFAGDLNTNQIITVTVKLHENKPAVKVIAKGSIDVLNRDSTEVVYSVVKENFDDVIAEVHLVRPEKTSGSVYDGSNAFTCEWDDEKETITVKAKTGFKFIKGKKYAFRLEVVKQYGVNGSDTREAKCLYTSDISIRPTQSRINYIVDRVPAFYRYVSEENNTRNVVLSTNVGTINSLALSDENVLPQGMTEPVIEGNNIKLCYDGVKYYSVKPGVYSCKLEVTMDGQLCKEVDGVAVEEPTICRIRFVIR